MTSRSRGVPARRSGGCEQTHKMSSIPRHRSHSAAVLPGICNVRVHQGLMPKTEARVSRQGVTERICSTTSFQTSAHPKSWAVRCTNVTTLGIGPWALALGSA